eukprot:scaffold885_cov209-Skeletonema_marinoi.AAC.4
MAINNNVSSSPSKATAIQYAKQGQAASAGSKKFSPNAVGDIAMPTTGGTTPPSSCSIITTKIKAPAKTSDGPEASKSSTAEFSADAVYNGASASSDANDRDASSSSVGAFSGGESFSCYEETVADDGNAIFSAANAMWFEDPNQQESNDKSSEDYNFHATANGSGRKEGEEEGITEEENEYKMDAR